MSLNNAADYVMLSYTWGPHHQNPLHVIRLEETTFPVTQNLYTALRHLRPLSSSDAALKIWTDAVCIKQSENLEKADRVRKMRLSTNSHPKFSSGSAPSPTIARPS